MPYPAAAAATEKAVDVKPPGVSIQEVRPLCAWRFCLASCRAREALLAPENPMNRVFPPMQTLVVCRLKSKTLPAASRLQMRLLPMDRPISVSRLGRGESLLIVRLHGSS